MNLPSLVKEDPARDPGLYIVYKSGAGIPCDERVYRGVNVIIYGTCYMLDGVTTRRGLRGSISKRGAWKAAKAEINAKIKSISHTIPPTPTPTH